MTLPRLLCLAPVLLIAACQPSDRSAAPASGPAQPEPPPAATATALPATAGAAPPSLTRKFRDWRATCDNANHCVAFGPATADVGFVMVALAPGPTATPAITAGSWELEVGGGPFEAVIDGRRYAGKIVPVDGGDELLVFTAPSRALLNSLAHGASMHLARGKARVGVSLSGAAAALLWIDERQGRLGTTTALARPGDRPAAAVPAAPVPPRLAAAAAAPQTGLPQGGLSSALLADPVVRRCRAATLTGGRFEPEVEVARLAQDKLLWSVPCGSGAYNFMRRYFITRADGGAPRPVSFPLGEGGRDDEPANSRYDPAARTLSAFSKGRGVGDCGRLNVWTWTGEQFDIREERIMPECLGAPPDLWPTTWRTAG